MRYTENNWQEYHEEITAFVKRIHYEVCEDFSLATKLAVYLSLVENTLRELADATQEDTEENMATKKWIAQLLQDAHFTVDIMGSIYMTQKVNQLFQHFSNENPGENHV